jgi:low temperature requirement protein LtrA
MLKGFLSVNVKRLVYCYTFLAIVKLFKLYWKGEGVGLV